MYGPSQISRLSAHELTLVLGGFHTIIEANATTTGKGMTLEDAVPSDRRRQHRTLVKASSCRIDQPASSIDALCREVNIMDSEIQSAFWAGELTLVQARYAHHRRMRPGRLEHLKGMNRPFTRRPKTPSSEFQHEDPVAEQAILRLLHDQAINQRDAFLMRVHRVPVESILSYGAAEGTA